MSVEKPPPAAKPKKEKLSDDTADRPVELEPDAWERFERAVDQVAKSPPQHRQEKGRANTVKKDN